MIDAKHVSFARLRERCASSGRVAWRGKVVGVVTEAPKPERRRWSPEQRREAWLGLLCGASLGGCVVLMVALVGVAA